MAVVVFVMLVLCLAVALWKVVAAMALNVVVAAAMVVLAVVFSGVAVAAVHTPMPVNRANLVLSQRYGSVRRLG